jgi:glutamate carboxypeptidase
VNLNAMLEDLEELVVCESFSADHEAVARSAKVVADQGTRLLGARPETIVIDGVAHLRWSFGTPRALLVGHHDTVWPIGTLTRIPWSLVDGIARGPGVFDMKAGLVQAVWAVRALRAAGVPHPPLRLLLNGDEEIGSPFSRPLIERACADAAAVLVFEASADGAVKTGRKGVGIFDLRVRGVESHAGLDPESGSSAIDEIARLVLQLHAAAEPAAGTTVNVGVLQGGTRSNVVAGSARAGVDVRVRSVQAQERIDQLLRGLAPRDPRVRVTVRGGWNRPVMEPSTAIASVYALAHRAAERLGFELRETSVGGASDGNFAAAMGRPVLDGLGAVGGGAHARHEHVSIEGMVERAAVAAAVIGAFRP